MDPEDTYLGRMLVEEITPAVMVLQTPMVEEACQKNGLNFVQMLSPFCLFNKIDVPVRTASDQPYRLQMFKLRLVYASDMHQENVMAANEHLKQVVSNASEEAFSDSQSDSPDTGTMLNVAESKPQPSWFQNFNKELLRSLSFSDHEAFDHPVACLLVVSSKDEHPINKFVDLFNTDQLPSLLNEGAMDPKILKYYLLVHDNQDGNSEKATNILAEMRSTFGSSDCGLLCINSVNGVVERTNNLWAPYKNDSSLHSDFGCFLSLDDHNEMKDFMQDLSSKHIIPHMEQKVRVLNQQVSATRRGFRNQIKNLWWRKGKDDTPDAPTGPMYTFSSLESQIRVLADYAFMLRDYELALSNYRLLSTDYKLDKAWKRYAGVQEMIGLSYFMLDQSRKEAEYCMENAFNTYLKIGSSGKRYATRCGLWWAEMLKAWGLYREAASVYFCISNEEPCLHAAVFLEQSSYCYLFSKPPMLRKYGFHLVLAGSRYDLSDQRKHAIRTYKSALSVYKGSAWNYINDIVHFNIGRWHSFLGVYDVAIKHMLEVLVCAHQPLPTQQLFLSEFLHTVQSMGKTYEVHGLQLPVINMLSLKVIYEDHRTYASSTAVHVKESLWQSLEEDMVPVVPTTRANWLESLPKLSKKYSDFCICVSGEAIKVHLEFKNPLRTSISLSNVSLVCELSARSTGMQSGNQSGHDLDGHRSTTDHQDNEELFIINSQLRDDCSEQNSSKSSFILSEIDFALQGGEAMMVELSVTPKVEGILNILGVRWTLSGSVVGYHYFKPDLNRKKHKKGRNLSSSSRNLKFVAIKSLPKLDGCLHPIPKKAYAGDLRLLVLELKNQSKFSVKNLKMKISHPRFLFPGRLKDMDVEFPACLQKQISRECSDVQTNIVEKPNGLLFSFPEDATIQGGTTFCWPLWLHAGSSGSTSLYLSTYYEMENSSSDMSYRTLRMHYNLEVLPSLDVAVQITPCSSRLQDFLVRMDITNRTNSECFWLRQLSSVGYQWKISSLSPDVSICPSQLVLAGQALSCFFKLKDYVKSVTTEGTNAAPDMHPENAASPGSQGNHEASLDITRSPLADFHRHERSHFQKSIQNCLSTVDFILLSQPQEDETNIEPRGLLGSPWLYSHHTCLCSIGGVSPILWLMNGPQTVEHDFSVSFCEIRLRITIRSCSDVAAVVKIHAFDSVETNQQLSDGVQLFTSGNHPGWHSISLSNDLKVLTNFQETQSGQPPSQSISSFVWSASSSTQVLLKPMSTAEIPLQICIFSPGTYDLSNYVVQWSLQLSDAEGSSAIGATRQSSGTGPGHPYYLTAMQSP